MNRSMLASGVWLAWFSTGLALVLSLVVLALAVLVVVTAGLNADPAAWWTVTVSGAVATSLFIADRYLARLYRRQQVPVVRHGFEVLPVGVRDDRSTGAS